MLKHIFSLLLYLTAALIPFFPIAKVPEAPAPAFPGWPTTIQGEYLTVAEVSPQEKAFHQNFPGKLGRFLSRDREVFIRWIYTPSRKLHPAADCFRAYGYSITSLPLAQDSSGALWSCITAKRDTKQLRVCEVIVDANGRSWSDASSWYWQALFKKSTGPWWAYTVAQEI